MLPMAQTGLTALARDYAPTGTLRVALNHGNRVLVGRDAQGKTYGITVDLAELLAGELRLPLAFVEFERAVDVSSRAADGVWDVCFLAVDPERARTIAFTQPYIRIEGCYLVAPTVRAADAQALAVSGAPIGMVEGSAYSLHLLRQPGAERLKIFPDGHAALAAMDAGAVAGIAGIRQAMEAAAVQRPGARVLLPPFMQILQAMGVPAGRPAAAEHLLAFLAQLARSGRIGAILERHGVTADCAVMP
jgi:polar amino acid transport system substrate-binding protein